MNDEIDIAKPTEASNAHAIIMNKSDIFSFTFNVV